MYQKKARSGLIKEFDNVVVASGHYHAPRVPDIPGLTEWKRRYPQRVQHSKGYRKPEDFHGKRIQNFLLIGGSVSATDIARELGPYANTIYQSHRNGQFDLSAALLPENAIRVDEVISFTATFTLFEFQAMAVAHVFAGDANLPGQADMRAEYVQRVKTKGLGKGFHSLRDKEVEYVDELLAWVNAELGRRGKGALPGHTEQWRSAREEQVLRIKALFAAPRGEERAVEVACQSFVQGEVGRGTEEGTLVQAAA
ncbi:hypothetical protein N0V95_005322 [Ascochyta clinopodiicola]|nr:hypothetical protein N0V95_005322 [Ascochyta clinopodiicola]